MIKYKIGIIVTLLTINNASAKFKNFYINAEVGILKSEKAKSDQGFYKLSDNNKFDSSLIYNLGIGYKISDKLRSELSYAFSDLKYSVHKDFKVNVDFNQNIKIKTGMVNLYYDILGQRNITPYLGVGLGYSNINPKYGVIATIKDKAIHTAKKSNNLTYAVMGGMSFKMNEKVNLDIGYKYQDFGKANEFHKKESVSGSIDIPFKKFKIKTHSATIGIRFNF